MDVYITTELSAFHFFELSLNMDLETPSDPKSDFCHLSIFSIGNQKGPYKGSIRALKRIPGFEIVAFICDARVARWRCSHGDVETRGPSALPGPYNSDSAPSRIL